MGEILNNADSLASRGKENVWVGIALRKAAAFSDQFKIDQELEFKSPIQSKIFDLYFAHYIIRKAGANTHYILNHPAGQTLRKIPILNKLPQFLDKVHTEEEDAAQILIEKARVETNNFETLVKTTIYEELSKRFNVGVEVVEKLISKDESNLVDQTSRDLINALGSPNAIQRGANLLSTLYVGKKEDDLGFVSKVKSTLSEIKRRDFSHKE